MEDLVSFYEWFFPLIIVLIIWEIVWKLIGMWKAAQNKQKVWFVCIALINTLGILPIIYILMNNKKTEDEKI